MNYRKILEDFVNNENTEYCYDWQGFNYEIILPCIEQLLKNENNLQSKIDKAIEYIERVQESENNINPYTLHAPTLLTILKGDDK